MYIRRTRVQGDASKVDQSAAKYEQMVPTMKQAPGFRGTVLLVDRDTGAGLSVTMWETEEAEQASRANAERAREQMTSSGDVQVTEVESFEEVIAERTEPGRVGSAVRVNDVQAAPEKVDEGIRMVRERVAPLLKQQPGFQAMLMGVNRANGRVYVTSVWNSAAERDASDNDALRNLRREAAEAMGASNVAVGQFELVFADVSQPATAQR